MTQHTTASRRRKLRRKLVQTIQQIGVRGGIGPLEKPFGNEELVREGWSDEPMVLSDGGNLRLEVSIVPDGMLVKHICDSCFGRFSKIVGSEARGRVVTHFNQPPGEGPSPLAQWIEDHSSCRHRRTLDVSSGKVAEAIAIVSKRARSYLLGGQATPPMMVALFDADGPLRLDLSPVFEGPWKTFPHRAHRYAAAVRRYAQLAEVPFQTVVTYTEGYTTLREGQSVPAEALSDIGLAAHDDRGRWEVAMLLIETPSSAFNAVAPIIRRSGRANLGSGRLGQFQVCNSTAFENLDGLIVKST